MRSKIEVQCHSSVVEAHILCCIIKLTVALTGALLSRDRLTEESCDREYSLEEIQRYITFAKQFKPKVHANAVCR